VIGSEVKKNGKDQVSLSAQQIALELAKAFRGLALYPLRHPQLKNILHSSYEKIFYEMSKTSEMAYTVGRDGLSHQGKLLDKVLEAVGEFANELHVRQVRKFALRSNLSERDLVDFLRMLLIPADQFRSGKKLEDYFRQKQISTIWVNEVDFGKLFLGKKAGSADEASEEESSRDFHQVQMLVQGLDMAQQDEQALAVLGQIEGELQRLASEQKFPELWYLAAAVSDFCDQKRRGFPRSAQRALALVRGSAQPGFLAWVVERFNYSDESSGSAFERYFDQAGERAVQAAAERAIKPEVFFFQKRLIAYLKSKGGSARPFLEARLKGQKGFQARKLIYMLGELRNPESAPLLYEFVGDEDKAVRLEAIRGLGKIRSKNVINAFVVMVRDKRFDEESRSVVVQILGDAQAEAAVPGLIEILGSRSEASELREKAAEALGKIGSREALSVLCEALEKPKLFRKPAPEKVRLKAAEALAKIGGERAEFVLDDLSRDQGILAQYCRELLNQIRTRKAR